MSTSNTSRPAVRSPALGEHWDEKPDSNWKRPYCEAFQVLLEGRYDTGLMKIRADGGLHGKTALLFQAVVQQRLQEDDPEGAAGGAPGHR